MWHTISRKSTQQPSSDVTHAAKAERPERATKAIAGLDQPAAASPWSTHSRLMRKLQAGSDGTLMRQADSDAKKDDKKKEMHRSADPGGATAGPASLAVSSPSDASEQEAERVAAQVAASTPGPVQIHGDDGSGASALMRKSKDDEQAMDPDQKKKLERRAEASAGGVTEEGAAPLVESVLGTAGAPLQPSVRADLEARFGQDFSDVRVHSGAAETASAHAVGAEAYTVGSDIVLREASLDATTTAGRKLLAHELTHVVQHRGGTPSVGGGSAAVGGSLVAGPTAHAPSAPSAEPASIVARPLAGSPAGAGGGAAAGGSQ